jgi:UPF0755 protein
MRRALPLLAAVLGVIMLSAVAAVTWLMVVYPNRVPAKGASRTVAIDMPQAGTPGALGAVAAQLTAARLIDRPRVFMLYARVLGAPQRLRFGRRVLVTSQMTVRQLLQRTAAGFGTTPLLITIPEGWNRFDVAHRLADWDVCPAEEFLAQREVPESVRSLDPKATNSEGYLFPDTYWLHDGMRAEQVIERLTGNAHKRLQKLLASEAAAAAALQREFGFGVHEIVTLASIVEREAHVPSEQPLIAGVFLNRLRDPQFRPKRLQADPTVAYGCFVQRELPSCAGFDGKHVTRTMTADPANPFNTYRIEGLPPSPIANPGISALRAVLHPAEHSFLYFVARGDGQHTFSTTLGAHNLAVHRDAAQTDATTP